MPLFAPNIQKMKEKSDVEGLIKALSYKKDSSIRIDAAIALGQIGHERAVDPLSECLKDEEFLLRRSAAEALGEIGDVLAVEPLSECLKDGSMFLRKDAATALGKIGTPAIGSLIAAFMDEIEFVRQAASEALVQIGAPATGSLIAALMDENKDVRQAAGEALDKLGWKPGQDEASAWHWVTQHEWGKCVEIGAPAVEPLIAMLNSNHSAAARALGLIGDVRAVEPLIVALNDESKYMREAAAEALVKMYHEKQIDETYRQRILTQRARITSPFIPSGGCAGEHDDSSIGVDFPL